jgi:hypothetical protein
MLEKVLDDEFITHLPPLLNGTRPADEQKQKNQSRAFSAFAICHICGIPKIEAAKSVIDDFDDYGIDAIYYHAQTETLYLVQSKLKDAEQFTQPEALAYCQGVRKLIKQDLAEFNKNVQKRQIEIEDALDNCSHIQLVVAHTGTGISQHAKHALDELLSDEDHGEERLSTQVVDYDATRVVKDLRELQAYERVDVDMWVQRCSSVNEPKVTYFGLVQLADLVQLHEKYKDALYERNIRTFLGHKTEVNASIQQTLAEKPKEFLYLNNGVTALCQEIFPKGTKQSKGGNKRLKLHGFSIINGAQTIASSAKYAADNKGKDISEARVSITIIKARSDGDFGKSVTRARNHQNPVLLSNFAALDDEQERLRRELALLGIHYAYKADAPVATSNAKRIRIDEAAQALAMLNPDPRFVVWIKKEPSRLLDTSSDQYKSLFAPSCTAFRVINAVFFYRYIQDRMANETIRASGQERLVYKHGNYAIAWILAKRVRTAINLPMVFDETKLKSLLSMPFDELRQVCWNKTQSVIRFKGPLALFRNQTDVIPLLQEIMIEHCGFGSDPIVEHKKKQQKTGQPYPEELFAYLVSKAPQIGNLS